MVDVGHRISSKAHVAGLKRLSARAHAGATPPSSGGRRCYVSFAAYARTVIDHLRNCRVPIDKGLTDEEFARVEAAFCFTFPPDLRAILQEGLPVGEGFPNWRHDNHKLQMRFDLPIAGLLYEVARGNAWWKQWGPRPVDTDQAVRIALVALRKVATLVPVYSHCYIPTSPNIAGNPIFFVHRRDVLICGVDVADFFQRELFVPHDYQPPTNLPDLNDWIEDGGNRMVISRMGSGRDLFKDRGRVTGKENFILSIRSGENETQEGHYENGASRRGSDALGENGTDETERKWEGGTEKDFESWGRSLDSLSKHSDGLFKSLDNLGRRASSKGYDYNPHRHSSTISRSMTGVAKNPTQDCVSRFSFFEDTPLSSKTLAHFSMNSPAFVTKSARRIEFWSELTEKRQSSNILVSENLFSAQKVDMDLANFSPCWEDQGQTKYRNTLMPNWMMDYMEDMTVRLRRGGWKEHEIDDMMEPRPAAKKYDDCLADKQSILIALSRQAELLQATLRAAGWSMRDVAEMLTVDRSRDHRRAVSHLSPELATRISTFAEYVVNA